MDHSFWTQSIIDFYAVVIFAIFPMKLIELHWTSCNWNQWGVKPFIRYETWLTKYKVFPLETILINLFSVEFLLGIIASKFLAIWLTKYIQRLSFLCYNNNLPSLSSLFFSFQSFSQRCLSRLFKSSLGRSFYMMLIYLISFSCLIAHIAAVLPEFFLATFLYITYILSLLTLEQFCF